MNSYRMKNKAAMLTGMLLPVALWLSSCAVFDPNHSRDQDEEARSPFRYQLAADEAVQFSIHGVNGNIEIIGTQSSDSVEVWGERVVRSDDFSDAKAHLEVLILDVRRTESGIVVRTNQPDQSDGRSYAVDYHVRLPRSMGVMVELANGEVRSQRDFQPGAGRIDQRKR